MAAAAGTHPADLLAEARARLALVESEAWARAVARPADLVVTPEAEWGRALVLAEIRQALEKLDHTQPEPTPERRRPC